MSETFRVNFDSYPQTTQQLDNLELNRTNVFHSLLVNEFSTKVCNLCKICYSDLLGVLMLDYVQWY